MKKFPNLSHATHDSILLDHIIVRYSDSKLSTAKDFKFFKMKSIFVFITLAEISFGLELFCDYEITDRLV